MPTTTLAVTAIHACTNEAAQPTAARINDAFRQTFSPDKGWIMLGGAPRITRTVHRDARPGAVRARETGYLTIGRGILMAPITMGVSLGPALATAAVQAGAEAIVSVFTTTATAIVETQVGDVAAREKIRREFQARLGAGWGSVVVEPYAPAVNGPLELWRDGNLQRASGTQAPAGLSTLMTAPVENPIGPTPPNPPSPVANVITSVGQGIGGAIEAGARGARAGAAQVLGGVSDGLDNLTQIPRNVAANAAATVGWLLAGVAGIIVGGIALVSITTRRAPGQVARDAFALTPAGRARSVGQLLRGNPARPAPPPEVIGAAITRQFDRLELAERRREVSARDAARVRGELATAGELLMRGAPGPAWATMAAAGRTLTAAKG